MSHRLGKWIRAEVPAFCAVLWDRCIARRGASFSSLRRRISECVGAGGCWLSFRVKGETSRRIARECAALPPKLCIWSPKRFFVHCAMLCMGLSIAGTTHATAYAIADAMAQNSALSMLPLCSALKRSVGIDPVSRTRLVELTARASEALLHASWMDGVTPTIDAPLDLERNEILMALVSDTTPPPRGAWAALRAGRNSIGEIPSNLNSQGDGVSDTDRTRSVAIKLRGMSLTRDEDLDRACALLVKHALIKALASSIEAQEEDGLGPAGPLPADIVRRIADALPPPPDHPGSEPVRQRLLKRLERTRVGARLPKSLEAEVRDAERDFREAHAVARAWLARLDVVHGMLARLADVEGMAVVRVSRAIRLASVGWDPEIASTMDARPLGEDGASPLTGIERPFDRVLGDIRAARNRGFACGALAETLRSARIVDVEVVESVVVDGEGILQLGRRRVRVTGERLDDWRRACGVRPIPTQSPPPARGPAPSRRIRDAPFGIKPLG